LGQRILEPSWQAAIGFIAITNTVVYFISINALWLGRAASKLAMTLNHPVVLDAVLIWFSVCALFFLPYVVYAIVRRGISLMALLTLLWCIVWIAELLWIHKFLIIG
jgi:hypothetical protein